MVQVRNVPARRDVTEEDVKRMVESLRPLKVHSVTFDQQSTEKVLGRRTAIVRMEPLPLPWTQVEDEVSPRSHHWFQGCFLIGVSDN